MRHLSSGSLGSSLLTLLVFLVSCAAPQPAASQALHPRAGGYALEVLVDGVPVRTFAHAGQTYVLGSEGSRYLLRVHNHSARRIEAVVTVDGLDVMDGKPGDFSKRGYLVPAHGHVDIEGWRLNMHEAAAFRFAPVAQSYAAKTGSARNVGVIGVAVFPERAVQAAPIARRPMPTPPAPVGAPQRPRVDRSAPTPADSWHTEAPRASAPAPAGSGGARAEAKGAADEAQAPSESEASASMGAAKRRTRSGLGTEFGEAVGSHIREVSFTRAHPARPAFVLGLRYDDRAGLLALGIDLDRDVREDDRHLRVTANPFPLAPRGFAQPPTDWRRD